MAYPSNRQPTIDTDSVAQDQIRAFVERIERMHEERKAIADDIKEIYAEAKGNGFDVKALKIVVQHRSQDHAERMELEALIELYESALGMRSASRDHEEDGIPGRRNAVPAGAPARARTVPNQNGGLSTTQNTSNSGADSAKSTAAVTTSVGELKTELTSDHDPVTGVIIEDNEPASGRPSTDVAADADDAEEPPQAEASSATQSTAARDDVLGTEGKDGVSPSPDRTLVDESEGSQDFAPAHGKAEPGERLTAPVDTISPTDKSGSEAGAELPAPSNVTTFTLKPHDGPVSSKGLARHKLCRNLELCPTGWREPCRACVKAHEAEIAVEPGGVQIAHQGTING